MWQLGLTMNCHLRPSRRDATANLKSFGARYTSDLKSMVSFTFTMQRHLIRLASAPLPPSVCRSLSSVCGLKLRSYFKQFVDQSSRNFEEIQETPCGFQCTYRLSTSCFVPKIYAIKSRSRRKTNKCSL